MKAKEKDVYRAKIESLEIRGGITPTGKASIILGMSSAQKENIYVSLKIDDKEKLLAIVDCIFTTIAGAELKKKNQTIPNQSNERKRP